MTPILDPVPRVEQQIFDLLDSDTTIATQKIQVTSGHPGSELADEAVFTDDGRDEEQAAGLGASGGIVPRSHQVTQEVVVYAWVVGGRAVDAKRRAWEITALVREALRPITDQSGLFMRPDGRTRARDRNYISSDGWAAEVVLEISGLVRTDQP